MKLVTSIPPRRDGVVVLTTEAGARIVFGPDANGELVADVEDEDLVAKLLRRGGFEPFDEADFDRATALLDAAEGGAADLDEDGGGEDAAADPDAPPVESNTPPKAAARPRDGRGTARRGRDSAP